VLEGMEVVKKIEKYGTREGTPQAYISIRDCGELK
jgi:hypothetical protein